jgi:hypothetical protein
MLTDQRTARDERAVLRCAGNGIAERTLRFANRRRDSRRAKVFDLLKSEERKRRRNVRLDRKHLEARSQRFLKIYLNANDARKPQFY